MAASEKEQLLHEVLNAEDRLSPTWLKIKRYYERRIDKFRKQNDEPRSSEVETAIRRGRIAEMKNVLGLEKSLPPHEPDNPPDGA